jgi:cytochrome c-type biogenesis protein
MLNGIFEWLNNIMMQNIYMAVTASFLWGILSVMLSPCHLSSLPLIIGYINRKGIPTLKTAFFNSLLFALGILITIAIIGLITGLLGGLIGYIGITGNYIVAIVFFAAGLYLLDVINPDWNFIHPEKINSKGYLLAFLLGLLFGAGLGPCTFAYMAPVLGVVFQYSATNFTYAILLIAAFAIGHCTVIALAGTMSAKIGKYLNWADNSAIIKTIKRVCGVLVILGGVYFIYTTL